MAVERVAVIAELLKSNVVFICRTVSSKTNGPEHLGY